MSAIDTLSVQVIRADITGQPTFGPFGTGIAAETVGARHLSLLPFTIPPGAGAPAHLHPAHETAILILTGTTTVWFGERLESSVTVRDGDFVFIPAGVPHRPLNPSATSPCVGIVARSHPSQQEPTVARPDLDSIVR